MTIAIVEAVVDWVKNLTVAIDRTVTVAITKIVVIIFEAGDTVAVIVAVASAVGDGDTVAIIISGAVVVIKTEALLMKEVATSVAHAAAGAAAVIVAVTKIVFVRVALE